MTSYSKPPAKPHVQLTALEYLCLKIAANPGKSSVWYLKQLNCYREGHLTIVNSYGFFFDPESFEDGRGFEDYFTNKYHGAQWISSYTVTDKGMNVAKRAAKMIGLTLS
jgi:hypothetical protein